MYEKCKDDDRIPDESDKTILERGYLKSNDLDEIKLEGLTDFRIMAFNSATVGLDGSSIAAVFLNSLALFTILSK